MARTADASAVELFESSRSRVRTIALAHSLAWRPGDTSDDLSDYLLEVTRHAATERAGAGQPSIELYADRTSLDFDAVVTLGLLVHELVTCAFQLAAPAAPDKLCVELLAPPGEELSLCVRIDRAAPEGDPLPPDGLAWKLAGMLAEQLSGRLELRTATGGERELGVRFARSERDATWQQS